MSSKRLRIDRTPLHLQVAAALVSEIRSRFKAGDKLPSESALARKYGVSTLTLREALASLARQGLVVRKHGSGTFVSDPQAGRYVAIVLGISADQAVKSGFFLSACRTLQEKIRKAGYSVRLFLGAASSAYGVDDSGLPEGMAEDVMNRWVLGIASLASPQNRGWLQPARDEGIPVVGDGFYFDHRVYVDYDEMIFNAVRRLASEGCSRIGMLAWGVSDADVEAAFSKAGVPYVASLIRQCDHPASSGAGFRGFCDLWHGAQTKPDGLVVCDELLFNTAAMAIMELGIKVPQQIRIVTHSNRSFPHFSRFPVVRMEYDSEVYGDYAARILLGLIGGSCKGPRIERLPFKWVEDAPSKIDSSRVAVPAVSVSHLERRE